MRQVWERWVPRTEDYWATFSSPFRKLVTDEVDKATPPGGSVMDFGCGCGVQSFLIRQRRPDVMIYAVDCNLQARNLTQILFQTDDRLSVEPTPMTHGEMHEVDTVVSIFTCSYLFPRELDKVLTAFCAKAKTLIFAEPTSKDNEIEEYAGMPTGGYRYPYPWLMAQLGWPIEITKIEGEKALNMMTVARRPEAVLAQLS